MIESNYQFTCKYRSKYLKFTNNKNKVIIKLLTKWINYWNNDNEPLEYINNETCKNCLTAHKDLAIKLSQEWILTLHSIVRQQSFYGLPTEINEQ